MSSLKPNVKISLEKNKILTIQNYSNKIKNKNNENSLGNKKDEKPKDNMKSKLIPSKSNKKISSNPTEENHVRTKSNELDGKYIFPRNMKMEQQFNSYKSEKVSKIVSSMTSDCSIHSLEKVNEVNMSNSHDLINSREYLEKGKSRKDYFSEMMNNSQNRLKNYSNLMDIINNSLSDIKIILNEELKKRESNSNKTIILEEDNDNTNIDNTINNITSKNKKSHKIIRSCDENELEKIRKELGINEGLALHSRNKIRERFSDKIYMTTIDENEEKYNESNDKSKSDCSSIQENVIIHQPKRGKIFSNVFTKKLNKSRSLKKNDTRTVLKNLTNKSQKTEITTVENDFLEKVRKLEKNKIVYEPSQGYIIKRNEKSMCSIKKMNSDYIKEAGALEINLRDENKSTRRIKPTNENIWFNENLNEIKNIEYKSENIGKKQTDDGCLIF